MKALFVFIVVWLFIVTLIILSLTVSTILWRWDMWSDNCQTAVEDIVVDWFGQSAWDTAMLKYKK